MNCPVPNCPETDKPAPKHDPSCMCNQPWMIYIPPGQHFHPCPVHPNVVMKGDDITCFSGRRKMIF